jgi:hypothetical protein
MPRIQFRELALAFALIIMAAVAWFADRQAIFDAFQVAQDRAKASADAHWRE